MGEVVVQGVGGTLTEGGVDLAVPLADPRHDFGQPGKERGQPFGVPAVDGRALLDQGRQRQGLLAVVPPGPAEQQGVVAAGARAGDRR